MARLPLRTRVLGALTIAAGWGIWAGLTVAGLAIVGVLYLIATTPSGADATWDATPAVVAVIICLLGVLIAALCHSAVHRGMRYSIDLKHWREHRTG